MQKHQQQEASDVLFHSGDLLVTSQIARFGGRTCSIAQIASVSMHGHVDEPRRGIRKSFILIGSLLVIDLLLFIWVSTNTTDAGGAIVGLAFLAIFGLTTIAVIIVTIFGFIHIAVQSGKGQFLLVEFVGAQSEKITGYSTETLQALRGAIETAMMRRSGLEGR